MSVLVDRDILAAMDRGEIVVDPFDRSCLGSNSYDVHLAPTLRVYDNPARWGRPLDAREDNATSDIRIPDDGVVLRPGRLYLASTVEHTESRLHVPILNGRSSVGRLGLSIHVTAGTGDVGFCGRWTMELFVVEPLRVYAGMPVGQLLWMTASDVPEVSYADKPTAKYGAHADGASLLPQPSRLHEDLARGGGRGA